MTGWVILLIAVGVLVLLTIPVLMFLFVRAVTRRRFGATLTQAVLGELTVTRVGVPPRHGMNSTELFGVLELPGHPAQAVERSIIASLDRWPAVGDRLPVLADPAHPNRFQVQWELVPSRSDQARAESARIAAERDQRG